MSFKKHKKVNICARLKMYDYGNDILYEFMPEFLPDEFWKDGSLIDKDLLQNFINSDKLAVSTKPGQLPCLFLNKNEIKEKKNFRTTYNHTFEYILTPESSYGLLFQDACQCPEWQAALIVYEKYRRKLNLEHKDLITLRNYIVDWSIKREFDGKKVNKDILVQECSSYIKKLDGGVNKM